MARIAAEFEISTAFAFKKVIDALKTFTRITMFFPSHTSDSEPYLKIIEENEEKTLSIAYLIEKSNLTTYVCPADFSISISISDLDRGFKSLKRKESAKVIVDRRDSKMTIQIKSGITKSSSFAVIFDDEDYTRETPSLALFPDVFSIPAKDFVSIKSFKAIGLSSAELTVETTDKNIRLSCDSGDSNSSITTTDDFDTPDILFKRSYPLIPFIDIAKLSSVTTQDFNIFPRDPSEDSNYTLKVTISVIGLGSFNIYIKDIETVKVENEDKIKE